MTPCGFCSAKSRTVFGWNWDQAIALWGWEAVATVALLYSLITLPLRPRAGGVRAPALTHHTDRTQS